MHFLFSTALLISSTSALQIPSLLSPPEPFYAPLTLDLSPQPANNETLFPQDTSPADSNSNSNAHHDLLKRADNCPSNYNSCSTLKAADAGACCPTNAICSTDSKHNIACCAVGASCTGTITVATATTKTTSPASNAATATGAFVSNNYFPFPILATTYANAAACTSATNACASNYALCTVDLEGGMGGGFTVSAPNGGVTVAASSPSGGYLGAASAVSVCQSLSSVACNAVESAGCAKWGTTGTTTGTGASFVIGTNAAGAAIARPTMMGCIPYAAAVMGLGVVGGMV